MRDDPTLLERFESKVYRIPGGCWIWTGTTTDRGYGELYRSRSHRRMRAHRVAWVLYRGPIPDGTPCVLHDCPGGDDPACVNPDHLWLGTTLDNNRDKARKGRGTRNSGKLPYGVRRSHWHSDRFQAVVRVNGKHRYLGTFDSPEEAAEAALSFRS